ncbi:peroxiredoxin Q/BCP [Paenibacillus algorifonticola]|uniref:thioredoxin-dependent peroxiredoxin n=1 Tax=Paenibacillus algorifonticola TaxID=684063 RepID=A0A1I2FBY7_9BACL|nr:thioredoxin-dependent thiol peroxidase [Paenibacillus algorifonticola]SFF02277.1 peroxiredoxin Q/BCP [Paenibacillus algorifonticola]
MSTIEVGQAVPDFKLPASDGTQVSLSDYLGKKVVLYFYPKDNTPTCTDQACDFRDAYPAMIDCDAVVIGISPDSVKSHEKFIAKKELPFLLLADEEHEVCELFGVWQLKKLYGKEYMGVVRSTFLIDAEGKLAREWRKVKVKGHVEQVVEALKEL